VLLDCDDVGRGQSRVCGMAVPCAIGEGLIGVPTNGALPHNHDRARGAVGGGGALHLAC
jgi:hypothetical protein